MCDFAFPRGSQVSLSHEAAIIQSRCGVQEGLARCRICYVLKNVRGAAYELVGTFAPPARRLLELAFPGILENHFRGCLMGATGDFTDCSCHLHEGVFGAVDLRRMGVHNI